MTDTIKAAISAVFFLFFFLSKSAYAQGVNAYANVTSIAGTTISVNNVSEADDTFEDGEFIVIMQMQDNVIGNTTNSASFGTLGTIQSAGLYEIREILSHTESGGLPATITVSASLTNTYNINSNASVQILTFPNLGAPDYTTTSDMSPPSWDGTVGGVLAFEVTGTLTLAHNISADFDGFRGGANDPNATTAAGTCNGSVYITTANGHANKGEGIFKSTVASHAFAKGKILNGGGGGSGHNGGGAGGGNYTAGGDGGIGYSCRNSTTQSVGGQGGLSLSGQISASRFFLGGGGGAGEQNNSAVTAGGNGGGIIIIRANEIETTGACGGLTISANGETQPDIGNDGGPGGGAGGSIFLDINTFTIASGCLLTVSANGGDGSTAITGTTHAGGGGGGQGVVIYTIPEPTTNVTTETESGNGGCANSSNPCNETASTGGGSPDDGIIPSSPTGPLPVALSFFNAKLNGNGEVNLVWETKSETNNDYFLIDKSIDGQEWMEFLTVKGAGNSTQMISYRAFDQDPYTELTYYRLSQIDFDGTSVNHGVRVINKKFQAKHQFLVYPNPTQSLLNIESSIALRQIKITNAQGQVVRIQPAWVNGNAQLNLESVPKGIYLLYLESENGLVDTEKIVVN